MFPPRNASLSHVAPPSTTFQKVHLIHSSANSATSIYFSPLTFPVNDGHRVERPDEFQKASVRDGADGVVGARAAVRVGKTGHDDQAPVAVRRADQRRRFGRRTIHGRQIAAVRPRHRVSAAAHHPIAGWRAGPAARRSAGHDLRRHARPVPRPAALVSGHQYFAPGLPEGLTRDFRLPGLSDSKRCIGN